jgi:hypothetical protein
MSRGPTRPTRYRPALPNSLIAASTAGQRGVEVRDEQRDIVERGLMVFLEIEAQPAGCEAAVAVRLFPPRQAPSARAPRRLSRGRSLVRSPRRARGCRVRAPAERSSEDGPARSCRSPPGPRRSRKSRGRIRRRILESYSRRKEPSGPKSARPSPVASNAPAVSVKPLGSRERYTCHLQRFNPSFAIASRRQPDPQKVGQGLTYGGSG